MTGEREQLELEHGVHIEGQQVVRFESTGPTADDAMRWLRDHPPTALGDVPIREVQDLLVGGGPAPSADTFVLLLDHGQISVTPSSTQPALELRGDFWRDPPASAEQLIDDRAAARRQLTGALAAAVALVSDPERWMTAARYDALPEHASDDDVAARAEALFASEPTSLSRADALRLAIESIDLTTLMGDDTNGRVRALCTQARRPDPTDVSVGPTAAVCVYPNLVALAKELTAESGVAVASVAGAFPSGLSSLEVRLSDIAEAVCAGADEVDVVINRAAFLSGADHLVRDELIAMRQQIGTRVMKVILETSELETTEAIRSASRLAMDAGADWIKTSTGKSSSGATPAAVLAMAEAIAAYGEDNGRRVGLKISGGVRTGADALGYLAIVESVLGPAWLDPSGIRFGASGLLTALVTELASG